MEEILKQLMNTHCIAMHNPSMRCYGKGCNGQCAQFQVALESMRSKNLEWLNTHIHKMNDNGVCLEFSNNREARQSITNL